MAAPTESAAWPDWAARRTGLPALGSPGRVAAWVAIALSLLTIGYVGCWNAVHYPVVLGYDSGSHMQYAHVLVHEHRLPGPADTAESNQPPAYYAVAGLAAAAGERLFGWDEAKDAYTPDVSYRGAIYLNVVLALLTALAVLWLARLVAPDRPWVWAAAVGFFAFLPVAAKTEAMFHPENLNMLASAVALAASVAMLARRRFSGRLLLLLAASLGVALASRASGLFLALAVVIGIGVALTQEDIRRAFPGRRVLVAGVIVVAIATPWVAYRAVVHHRGPLNETRSFLSAALHPSSHSLTSSGSSRSTFWHVSPQVFTHPYRSHYKNEALPETYTEIWGDWFGAMAWSPYTEGIPQATVRVLRDQSYIGVLPTVLAFGGWVALVAAAVRRKREWLPAALLPGIAIAGYLYRSYLTLSPDGDLFKASYLLNTAPVWAVSFGVATHRLASRSALLRYGAIVLFGVFAVLELRFMLYGIRDHRPIF